MNEIMSFEIHDLKSKAFLEKIFTLYLKGFGGRSVYFNGPYGTILHSILITNRCKKEFATWCNLGKCFVLTDAQMRASKILKDKHSIVDLRYNRTEAFKNFFKLRTFILFLKSLIISLHIYKNMKIFPENRFVHIWLLLFRWLRVSMSVNYYLFLMQLNFFGVLIIVLLLEQNSFAALSTVHFLCPMGQVLEQQAQYATEASLILFMLKMNFKKRYFWPGIQN